jgi:hypothetical protein
MGSDKMLVVRTNRLRMTFLNGRVIVLPEEGELMPLCDNQYRVVGHVCVVGSKRTPGPSMTGLHQLPVANISTTRESELRRQLAAPEYDVGVGKPICAPK